MLVRKTSYLKSTSNKFINKTINGSFLPKCGAIQWDWPRNLHHNAEATPGKDVFKTYSNGVGITSIQCRAFHINESKRNLHYYRSCMVNVEILGSTSQPPNMVLSIESGHFDLFSGKLEIMRSGRSYGSLIMGSLATDWSTRKEITIPLN